MVNHVKGTKDFHLVHSNSLVCSSISRFLNLGGLSLGGELFFKILGGLMYESGRG